MACIHPFYMLVEELICSDQRTWASCRQQGKQQPWHRYGRVRCITWLSWSWSCSWFMMFMMMAMMLSMMTMMIISVHLSSCRVHNRQFHWSRLPTALPATIMIMLIMMMMFVMIMMMLMMFVMIPWWWWKKENLVHQSVSSLALKSSLSWNHQTHCNNNDQSLNDQKNNIQRDEKPERIFCQIWRKLKTWESKIW